MHSKSPINYRTIWIDKKMPSRPTLLLLAIIFNLQPSSTNNPTYLTLFSLFYLQIIDSYVMVSLAHDAGRQAAGMEWTSCPSQLLSLTLSLRLRTLMIKIFGLLASEWPQLLAFPEAAGAYWIVLVNGPFRYVRPSVATSFGTVTFGCCWRNCAFWWNSTRGRPLEIHQQAERRKLTLKSWTRRRD